MKFARLGYEVRGDIALVSLNRANKLNAFDEMMFEDLIKVQKHIRHDRNLRAVIIKGEGSDFSSGLDIKSVMTNPKAVLRIFWKWLPWQANKVQKVSVGWRRLSIPVIFAIHGRCWGAGMQTALGGDFRFVAPKSSLAIMEARWGLIPDMAGSLALREMMSIDKALDYTMTAREILPKEALDAGLVTRVVDDPFEEAYKFALQLTEKSPDALAAIKKLYQFAWHHNDYSLLAKEWLLQWRMLVGRNRKVALQKAMGQGEQIRYFPRSL